MCTKTSMHLALERLTTIGPAEGRTYLSQAEYFSLETHYHYSSHSAVPRSEDVLQFARGGRPDVS